MAEAEEVHDGPTSASDVRTSRSRWRRSLLIGLGLIVAAVLGVVGTLVFSRDPKPSPRADPVAASTASLPSVDQATKSATGVYLGGQGLIIGRFRDSSEPLRSLPGDSG